MRCQMRSLVIIAMTVVIVGAYKNKRNVVPYDADVMPYHKSRSRNVFFEQPFIDKTIDQQTSFDAPMRDPTINQQALRDISFREQSIYPPGFSIPNHQPFKQNSFHTVTTSRDELLFKDAVPRNRESRIERENLFRNSPFEGQRASLASEEIFEQQTSAYKNRTPFKKQIFTTETPFKNLFRGQSLSSEQASFQKEESFVEFPPVPNSMKFHRDDSYSKPIDSYGRQKDAQTQPYEGPTMYMEYDNHPLELSSMPKVSSSKHVFPLHPEMHITSTSAPITVHESASPTSSVSSITEVYSSEDFRMKLGPEPMLKSAASTSSGKCNTLVDSSSTTSRDAVTTVPSISVRTNQSSVVDHALTSSTAKLNSPVMGTEVANDENKSLGMINFHATKYGAVMTPYVARNELKSNVDNHPLSKTLESGSKFDELNLKYLMPETSKNDMKTDTRASTMLNYILSEEHKSGPKSDIQNSFANYALPEVLKHSWHLPQFSQPETSSSYTPLSTNEKLKLILPSISVAPTSTISWPTEIKRDVSLMLPAKSIIASDGVTLNNLPLNMNLPLEYMASIPNSLTANIPNSISESMTGSISTSIPGGMTADMPLSIPTLNLGQSLHRVEQLRQTQEARNPWYPTGLQLQLGGFGGINYMLHTSNPARPMELGITKAGLTLPKLPQPHAPAFAKIGVEYQL